MKADAWIFLLLEFQPLQNVSIFPTGLLLMPMLLFWEHRLMRALSGDRELALDLAEGAFTPDIVEHIPGVSNEWADALSRLRAPQPKTIPQALLDVPRTDLRARTGKLWRFRGVARRADT